LSRRGPDFAAAGRLAAACASDKKARDILLLDVRRFSSLADFYLLATVDSSPQLQAALDHVEDTLREDRDLRPLRRDGRGSAQWAVLDYGGLVVHVLHAAARQFYGLERLWEGARAVTWEAASPPPRSTARAPRAVSRKGTKSPVSGKGKKSVVRRKGTKSPAGGGA
jgi:ribosome-associated protein